jgi:hypothetical protein
MQYTRLYADAAGETHFEDVDLPLTPVLYAPPAPPVHLSAFFSAARVGFVDEPVGWAGDWHPSPHRQFILILRETFRVEVSDGAVRDFGPGMVLLLEDATGRGHRTQFVGTGNLVVAVIPLDD